jgi:hypothetical protein
MQGRIYIKEAKEALNLKDHRSLLKWAAKNQVPIFSDEGNNNRKYLMRMQFEYARMKKFILYLKIKYKDKWLEAFKAYSSMNITTVVELEETRKINFDFKTDNYKPKGEHEKNFLAILTKEIE